MTLYHSCKQFTPALIGFASLLVLSACSGVNSTKSEISHNDFPTLARLEFVAECKRTHPPRKNDPTYPLYQCVCSIDKIAEKLKYDEYIQAKTFADNKSMAGEKGGVFRDPPQAKAMRKKLQEVTDYAEKSCFFN